MKNFLIGAVIILLTLPGVARANFRDVSSTKVCQEGKPQCVNLVINQMQHRYKPLALCNHNAVFALNYLRTTEVFQQTLGEIKYDNTNSIIRLDSLFANYYFRAYDAYYSGVGNVPPAWQIAFDAATNRTVTGSGNLALGINAHIQRDLPFVLYELYLQGNPVSYEDYTRVNQFLQLVNPLGELAQKFDPTIEVSSVEDLQQQFQILVQWREEAYHNYERLRDAPTDEARAQVAAEIEEYSKAFASSLLQLYSYPPDTDSSVRDAYCQASLASIKESSSASP